MVASSNEPATGGGPLLVMVSLLWGPLDGQQLPVRAAATKVIFPWPPEVKKPRGAVYALRPVTLNRGDGTAVDAMRFAFSGWAKSA